MKRHPFILLLTVLGVVNLTSDSLFARKKPVAPKPTAEKQKEDSKVEKLLASDSASFRYADGSNNVYLLSSKDSKIATLEYKPMKPRFSSSGTYDGGTPQKKQISAKEYQSIRSLFEKIVNNRSNHTGKRKK
jgi:hypothetical protein